MRDEETKRKINGNPKSITLSLSLSLSLSAFLFSAKFTSNTEGVVPNV